MKEMAFTNGTNQQTNYYILNFGHLRILYVEITIDFVNHTILPISHIAIRSQRM